MDIDVFKKFYHTEVLKKGEELLKQKPMFLSSVYGELLLNKIEDEKLRKLVSLLLKDITNEIESKYFYGYLDGVQTAISNDWSQDALRPNNINFNENVLKEDFALVFHFGDNDFGLPIQKVGEKLASHFYEILFKLNTYYEVNSQIGIDYCKKELEESKNLNNLQNFFKISFIGSYLDNNDFDRTLKKEGGYEEVLKEAKRYTEEYLEFENNEQYIIGTCEEIDKYIKNNFEEKSEDGQSYYWDNGETLIIKIKNCKTSVEII